jgi:hypothetical protein
MHEQSAQALLMLYSQAAALKLLLCTGWLHAGSRTRKVRRNIPSASRYSCS